MCWFETSCVTVLVSTIKAPVYVSPRQYQQEERRARGTCAPGKQGRLQHCYQYHLEWRLHEASHVDTARDCHDINELLQCLPILPYNYDYRFSVIYPLALKNKDSVGAA